MCVREHSTFVCEQHLSRRMYICALVGLFFECSWGSVKFLVSYTVSFNVHANKHWYILRSFFPKCHMNSDSLQIMPSMSVVRNHDQPHLMWVYKVWLHLQPTELRSFPVHQLFKLVQHLGEWKQQYNHISFHIGCWLSGVVQYYISHFQHPYQRWFRVWDMKQTMECYNVAQIFLLV